MVNFRRATVSVLLVCTLALPAGAVGFDRDGGGWWAALERAVARVALLVGLGAEKDDARASADGNG